MPPQDSSRSADTVKKVDEFFAKGGLAYTPEKVKKWLERRFFRFATLPSGARILDMSCGGGVWAVGIAQVIPDAEIVGIDLSQGAIETARSNASKAGLSNRLTFKVHDCTQRLPFANGKFDFIFARGAFLFNQHDMMRAGCIELLEEWHRVLAPGGRLYASNNTKYDRMGTYTPYEDTAGLPLNDVPETTPWRDFRGGKFNHSVSSFSAPFFALQSAKVELYHFEAGVHCIITRREPAAP